MKLYEIANQQVDWNTKTEEDQIELVNMDGLAIRYIDHPSVAVQMAAINQYSWAIQHIKNPPEIVQLAAININGWSVKYIDNPTKPVLLKALKSQDFIDDDKSYNDFIKKYFANNTLLMKKWLRYGEAMRAK